MSILKASITKISTALIAVLISGQVYACNTNVANGGACCSDGDCKSDLCIAYVCTPS